MTGLNTSNSSDFQTPMESKNSWSRYKPNSGFGDGADGKGYLNCQVHHRLIRRPSWGQQQVPRCRWLLSTNSNQHFHSNAPVLWTEFCQIWGYSSYRANRIVHHHDIGQTPQRQESWQKVSILVSRRTKKRMEFSLGGCNKKHSYNQESKRWWY